MARTLMILLDVTRQGETNALDNLRCAHGVVVAGREQRIHVGWVYPYSASPGTRVGAHPNHPRSTSRLVRIVRPHSSVSKRRIPASPAHPLHGASRWDAPYPSCCLMESLMDSLPIAIAQRCGSDRRAITRSIRFIQCCCSEPLQRTSLFACLLRFTSR